MSQIIRDADRSKYLASRGSNRSFRLADGVGNHSLEVFKMQKASSEAWNSITEWRRMFTQEWSPARSGSPGVSDTSIIQSCSGGASVALFCFVLKKIPIYKTMNLYIPARSVSACKADGYRTDQISCLNTNIWIYTIYRIYWTMPIYQKENECWNLKKIYDPISSLPTLPEQ